MSDDNLDRIKDGQTRRKISPLFIWIPALVSFLIIAVLLLLKFSEKRPDSFTTWGWVVGIIFICLIVNFSLSLIIYLATSLRNKAPEGIQYSTREECDNAIRAEIKRRTGYSLSDFTETGDSIEGNGYYGKHGQALIYFHVYRIKKGSFSRYMLGMKNMEKDKDLVILVQSPMNFSDVDSLIEKYANRLTNDQLYYNTEENVFTNPVTGLPEIRRKHTMIQDEKKKSDDEEDENE